MFDLSQVKEHTAIKEIVDVLCAKTSNTDRSFFTAEVAFFLAKIASCMRANILTQERGEIPINMYALALSGSGYGKGHSVGIMENDFLKGFKRAFIDITLPEVASQHIHQMAVERAVLKQTNEDEEEMLIEGDYKRLGAYPFTFDSGTTPAVKQLRQKLLIAGAGSINLQIDEIGSNLIGSTEVLNTFLELYDQGIVKQKLTKNTADNVRGEDLDGKTPTNMLLFGTPVKLFDGGITEDLFYSFLEIGYARRCIFGIGKADKKAFHSMTPEQIFRSLTQPANDQIIAKWSQHFTKLADIKYFNWQITLNEPEAIKLVEYRLECEKLAETLADHDEIRKAELSHRYFKALKLAGALAFIDEALFITMEHLLQAIKIVEDSGEAFKSILTREKSYMKLAKYIASVGSEVTHADLTEALPFYKSSNATRQELMTLATAWGYKNNIIIKKTFSDGIDFFSGESLKETNLDKMSISISSQMADGYEKVEIPFDDLTGLGSRKGYHWCNHQFLNQHRSEANVLEGFNLIVLDVDSGCSLQQAQELLKDYKFIMYTTKRSTTDNNRFRVLLPTNYELFLNREDYKAFIDSIRVWLPFEVDECINQRSKKWETNDGTVVTNDGKLFDVLPFIPHTSKNESFNKEFSKIESLGNLERWFAQRIANGNRNNNMIKYALALVDSGLSFDEVAARVKYFNNQLKSPLSENELDSTILVTVAKRYTP